jgi:hypothetical protein
MLHVAEGSVNGVVGPPRLRKVYNYIVNVRKILGGSAEMFWNGGFPGTMFEVPPELVGTGQLDKAALTKEIEEYQAGFKRYLALSGIVAKQLAPNIADPDTHLNVQLMAITIALEIPMRVFLGSEEARLASQNDSEAWNRRVHRRQDLHVTPNILRPFIERLIMMGVLPKPAQLHIKWPDVYSVSESDRADITGKMVRALGEYVKTGASTLFPPLEFLTMIMDFTTDEAENIILAAQDAVKQGTYKTLDLVSPKDTLPGAGAAGGFPKSQAGRKKPVGSVNKVKKPSPSVNADEFIVNPATKCQRNGKPGFKFGEGGKCYTYEKGDLTSKKRALKKAKLQGANYEIARQLQTMESSDGDDDDGNDPLS